MSRRVHLRRGVVPFQRVRICAAMRQEGRRGDRRRIASERMSDRLAKVLAEGVRDRGADVVFGFPGGGPNLEVVGAVQRRRSSVRARPRRDARVHHGRHLRRARRASRHSRSRPAVPARRARSTARRRRHSTDFHCSSSPTACQRPIVIVSPINGSTSSSCSLPSPSGVGAWPATPRAAEAVRAALDVAGTRPAGAVHLDYDPTGNEMIAPAPSATAAIERRGRRPGRGRAPGCGEAGGHRRPRRAGRPCVRCSPRSSGWAARC